MKRAIFAESVCGCLIVLAAVATAGEGVQVQVTGGKVGVSDWLVQQPLDLDAAAKLLGRQGAVEASDVRVTEVNAAGETLAHLPCQIDRDEPNAELVVTWSMPGTTQPGQTREFLISLDGQGTVPAISAPVNTTADDDHVTIVNGPTTLEHARDAGGMIRRVTVGQASGELSWQDQLSTVSPGRPHCSDKHAAEQMRVVAAGPLRAVVEATTELLDGEKSHASRPRVTYRFTTLAGQPVTRIEAEFTQDFSKLWETMQRTQVNVESASLSGAQSGDQWAAAFSDKLLVGVADGPKPNASTSAVQIGGDGSPHWRSLRFPWRAVVYWGAGESDLEAVESWAAIVDSPPTTIVHIAPLDEQIAEATTQLAARERQATVLTGVRSLTTHVALTTARIHLAHAADAAASGRAGQAVTALARARTALASDASHVQTTDDVVTGMLGGHPFLGNEKVVFIWCPPEDGAGLLSMYDRRMKRQFLAVSSTSVPLWEIGVKKGDSGLSYVNTGGPCVVGYHPHGLEFNWDWPGAMAARLRATLKPGQTVVRMRLHAQALAEDEGLRNITFPIIPGIKPLTPGGVGDTMLATWNGSAVSSPLVTGNRTNTDYPRGMQFTAMIAEGKGLYCGEEDPDANRKDLTWMRAEDKQTIEFTIKKTVLDRAGPNLVKQYNAPGDIVIGPFQGDWYDAARLYRAWAVTAPWCAKGTIDKRADYPKWLAEAPFWTIGSLGSEKGVRDELNKVESFGVPGVCHAYGWWFQPHQDDGYPDYFPPRLGSEGLKRTIRRLQQANMRVVPYVNGLMWDVGNESYRVHNVQWQAIRGAGLEDLGMTFSGNRFSLICPHSPLWRNKLAEVSRELVERYGADGIYFDFLTTLGAEDWLGNCHWNDHGHAVLCGGNFWTNAVRGLYRHVRDQIKKINPQTMLCGEEWSEYVIDLLDTQLTHGHELPLFEAVYHGYTLFYGGRRGMDPKHVGRFWLYGNQNGWHDFEPALARALKDSEHKDARFAKFYRKLLHCHYHFGRPYLAYGEMVRQPRFEGDPSMDSVQSSAWKAPDGSVGVFLLNYETDKAQELSWSLDLMEGAGWGPKTTLALSKWTKEGGSVHVADVPGGTLRRKDELEPLGLVALKLELKK